MTAGLQQALKDHREFSESAVILCDLMLVGMPAHWLIVMQDPTAFLPIDIVAEKFEELVPKYTADDSVRSVVLEVFLKYTSPSSAL